MIRRQRRRLELKRVEWAWPEHIIQSPLEFGKWISFYCCNPSFEQHDLLICDIEGELPEVRIQQRRRLGQGWGKKFKSTEESSLRMPTRDNCDEDCYTTVMIVITVITTMNIATARMRRAMMPSNSSSSLKFITSLRIWSAWRSMWKKWSQCWTVYKWRLPFQSNEHPLSLSTYSQVPTKYFCWEIFSLNQAASNDSVRVKTSTKPFENKWKAERFLTKTKGIFSEKVGEKFSPRNIKLKRVLVLYATLHLYTRF